MPDIYLFRHAHVDYSPPNPIGDDNPLTSLGHRMAELLADRCAGWELQRLYVSTMRRAQETADAISARLPDLDRRDLPALEEASLKDLADYPGPLPPADMRHWQEAHYHHANARVWKRVTAAFDRILIEMERDGLERVALVGHGGSLNTILWHFQGWPADVAWWRCWFVLDWATSCCLRVDGDRRWVRWVNDARHIDPVRHLLSEQDRV